MTNPEPHRPDSGTRILIATILLVLALAWAGFPWEAFSAPIPAVTR